MSTKIDLDAEPELVFDAIHELMHQFRHRRQRALATDGEGLSHMEAKALGFFVRNPGASQSDLVAHTGRDKSQLARLIGSLRDKGLLEATPDERDRRSLRLHCTPAAQEMQRALRRQSRKLARSALASLDAGERLSLLALLRKVSAGLRGEEG